MSRIYHSVLDAGDALVFNLRVQEGQTTYLDSSLLPQTGVSEDVEFTVTGQPIRGVLLCFRHRLNTKFR